MEQLSPSKETFDVTCSGLLLQIFTFVQLPWILSYLTIRIYLHWVSDPGFQKIVKDFYVAIVHAIKTEVGENHASLFSLCIEHS